MAQQGLAAPPPLSIRQMTKFLPIIDSRESIGVLALLVDERFGLGRRLMVGWYDLSTIVLWGLNRRVLLIDLRFGFFNQRLYFSVDMIQPVVRLSSGRGIEQLRD
jgi:hypothetical protein